MDNIDIARSEREVLRWIILSTLFHARPIGCNEHVLLRTAYDIPLRATQVMVRQEMGYLRDHGLISINDSDAYWFAKLTANGQDLCDYRADCPKGIARPPKW